MLKVLIADDHPMFREAVVAKDQKFIELWNA